MDGYVTIGTELDTKEFDAQMRHIETKMLDIEDKLKQADMGFEVGDTEKLEAEYERLGNQLLGLKEKQEKYNQSIREAQMAGFNKIKESVDGVGNSLQKVTKRIAKMAIAVFGIRSAFMFVRRSIDMISQGDKQLSDDIEYMKIALAYTIEPIVRGIVNLAKQLMFYIAYIVKAWTGRNIFENANKGLANANKQAKALNKQLAGFDEMNVLNDSGKGNEAISPSFDLTAPEDVPIPGWIKWIAENKNLILETLAGITAGLIATKLGLSGIKALGFGLLITGIIKSIISLIKYIKNPSWENFGKIIQGIGIAILGLAAIFSSVPLAVAGAIVLITGILAQFWDKIEKFVNNVQNIIFNAGDKIINWLTQGTGILGPILGTIAGTVIGVVTGIIDTITSLIGGVLKFTRNVLDTIILLFRGDFKGALSNILKGIGNLFIDLMNTIIGAINTIVSPIRGLIVAIGKVTGKNWTMQNIKIPKIPRLAKGGIINMPGRGVPVGGASAIAGERGQEGVLPLTDSQQMDLLGQAIARHVVINNFVDNYIDGRKFNRILQSSNDRTRFAMNG